MRTRLWLAATLWLACNGNKDEDTTDEADADADADADSDADTDADTDAPQRGFMRFANIAEQYGEASLWVDSIMGPPAISLDPFNGTSWRDIPAGEHRFAVSPEGEQVDPETDPSIEIPVAQGLRYSLLLYGTSDAPGLVYIEDNLQGLSPNEVRYAVLNGAAGLASVDLWDATNQQPMISDLAYGEVAFDEGSLDERIVWIDLERDSVWDYSYTVPAASQAGVPMHLYLVYQGTELYLAYYSPTSDLELLPPTPLETSPTGDTGSGPVETGTGPDDTGDTVIETADTGTGIDTGTSLDTGTTGDTGLSDTGP